MRSQELASFLFVCDLKLGLGLEPTGAAGEGRVWTVDGHNFLCDVIQARRPASPGIMISQNEKCMKSTWTLLSFTYQDVAFARSQPA